MANQKEKNKSIISPFYNINKTMSKEVKLTIGERAKLIGIMNEFKGNLSTMSVLLEDIKPLTITEEDWKKAKLVKTPTDEEVKKILDADPEQPSKKEVPQQWKWQEDGSERVVKLQKESVDYILNEIKKKSDAGEITINDASLIAIDKKLK